MSQKGKNSAIGKLPVESKTGRILQAHGHQTLTTSEQLWRQYFLLKLQQEDKEDYLHKVIDEKQPFLRGADTAQPTLDELEIARSELKVVSQGNNEVFESYEQTRCFSEMLFMLKDGPEEMLVKFVTNLLSRIGQAEEGKPVHPAATEETEAAEEEAPQENIEQFLLERLMSGEQDENENLASEQTQDLLGSMISSFFVDIGDPDWQNSRRMQVLLRTVIDFVVDKAASVQEVKQSEILKVAFQALCNDTKVRDYVIYAFKIVFSEKIELSSLSNKAVFDFLGAGTDLSTHTSRTGKKQVTNAREQFLKVLE